MPIRKTYLAKVYDQGGTFRKVFTCDAAPGGRAGLQSTLKTVPTFSARINGGLGECVLELKARFDDFSEGTVIDFMCLVTVDAVVVDTETRAQKTTRIYKGFVSRYEPYVEGGDEGVRVTCLGLVSLLTLSCYGTSPDYAVTHTAEDPEAIAKAVIDNFNGAFGGSLIGYTGTTSAVGTAVTYPFTQQTWLQAVEKAHELAGAGWWWALRAYGDLHFLPKPGTATHTFTIGKDVKSLNAPKDSEKVKNEVIVVRAGGTKTTYADATSQATFGTGSTPTGRRTLIITDSAIPDATTAGQRGNKELNDQKDAKNATRIVIDSRYGPGIESIRIGQTCKVRNFAGAPTFLSDNMQIVGLAYQGDTVALDLEEHSASFGRELAAFVG
jgi:hypothetical protein